MITCVNIWPSGLCGRQTALYCVECCVPISTWYKILCGPQIVVLNLDVPCVHLMYVCEVQRDTEFIPN